MSNNQQARFKDVPWFPKYQEPVLVGGSGGIGSWLSFFLAKMGYSPFVYDFDTIEEHNLGGQLFRVEDVGKLKVEALADIIRSFSGQSINTFPVPINKYSTTHHYVFSAFDNMQAREDLFHVWLQSVELWNLNMDLPMPIFIDGRLEIEQLQIFCVTPDTIPRYLEHLFADGAVADAPCTMKQTAHTAAMIATLMASFFTNHITNVYAKEILRDVPFYYEFMVPMALTVLEN